MRRAVVKAAVACEGRARSVHLRRQLGEPVPLASTDVDSLDDRYQNAYGQHSTPQRGTPDHGAANSTPNGAQPQ